jgi:hypothetical protein
MQMRRISFNQSNQMDCFRTNPIIIQYMVCKGNNHHQDSLLGVISKKVKIDWEVIRTIPLILIAKLLEQPPFFTALLLGVTYGTLTFPAIVHLSSFFVFSSLIFYS